MLREYAFLADGHRGALVGPHGNIGWLCAPHWDSDAVFADLLGGRGRYAVTPADRRFVWGGFYRTGTLMWTNRWITGRGIVHCRDCLILPGDPHRLAARAMRTAAAAIAGRWTQPDAGVWELEPRQWTHSKLTCVAGLRAAARAVPGPQAAEWAACGPAGLYAEEYDVDQRQLRGNLPQAFVHAMLLEAAVRLGTEGSCRVTP